MSTDDIFAIAVQDLKDRRDGNFLMPCCVSRLCLVAIIRRILIFIRLAVRVYVKCLRTIRFGTRSKPTISALTSCPALLFSLLLVLILLLAERSTSVRGVDASSFAVCIYDESAWLKFSMAVVWFSSRFFFESSISLGTPCVRKFSTSLTLFSSISPFSLTRFR
jgi:hypothetical protein